MGGGSGLMTLHLVTGVFLEDNWGGTGSPLSVAHGPGEGSVPGGRLPRDPHPLGPAHSPPCTERVGRRPRLRCAVVWKRSQR